MEIKRTVVAGVRGYVCKRSMETIPAVYVYHQRLCIISFRLQKVQHNKNEIMPDSEVFLRFGDSPMMPCTFTFEGVSCDANSFQHHASLEASLNRSPSFSSFGGALNQSTRQRDILLMKFIAHQRCWRHWQKPEQMHVGLRGSQESEVLKPGAGSPPRLGLEPWLHHLPTPHQHEARDR